MFQGLSRGWRRVGAPERERRRGESEKTLYLLQPLPRCFWSKVDIKAYFKIIPYFDPNLCMAESDTFIAKI